MPAPGKAPAFVPQGNQDHVPADTLPELDVTPGIPMIPVEDIKANADDHADDALDGLFDFC